MRNFENIRVSSEIAKKTIRSYMDELDIDKFKINIGEKRRLESLKRVNRKIKKILDEGINSLFCTYGLLDCNSFNKPDVNNFLRLALEQKNRYINKALSIRKEMENIE